MDVPSVVGRHPLARMRGAREIQRDDVSHIGESVVTMAGSAYTVQTNDMDDSMASLGVGVQNWRDKRGSGADGSVMNCICAVEIIDIGSGERQENDVNRPWFQCVLFQSKNTSSFCHSYNQQRLYLTHYAVNPIE